MKEGILLLQTYDPKNTTPITTFSRCSYLTTVLDCGHRGHMVDTLRKESTKQNNQPCCFFEIRVQGHISSEWSDWFENMVIRLLENGETVLSGPIVDQAALMGILNKLNRLNLPLLSLNEVSLNKDVAEGERNGAKTSIEPKS